MHHSHLPAARPSASGRRLREPLVVADVQRCHLAYRRRSIAPRRRSWNSSRGRLADDIDDRILPGKRSLVSPVYRQAVVDNGYGCWRVRQSEADRGIPEVTVSAVKDETNSANSERGFAGHVTSESRGVDRRRRVVDQ